MIEKINTFIDIFAEYAEHIISFFSFLFESSKSVLNAGNLLVFVLFVLLIMKAIKNINIKG